MNMNMNYYAVHKGNTIGIFNNWNECKESIDNYNGASFKKFNNKKDAEYFVLNGIEPINNIENFNYDICVYTDGSCINNGKENALAGIGIYFNDNDPRNVAKKISGNEKQTNNTAELTAIICAYDILENEINQNKNILIVTDSIYSIRCCTTYGKKIHNNGYPSDTKNLKYIRNAYSKFRNKDNIKFLHVASHTNKKDKHSIGNMKADILANKSIGRNIDYNNNNKNSKKIYINVKYDDKEDAKKLGCKWDPDLKSWYYTEYNNKNNINRIKQLFCS